MFTLSLLLLGLTWTATAAPLMTTEPQLETRDTILLPSQDPFYQPPAGYECEAPGAILAKRQIDTPPYLESLLPGATESVWQILFRSTDSQGEANAVVTTLFVPKNKDRHKFFTHAPAYDAADVDCSPSYALRTANSSIDIAVIALGLSNGWYIQSPDYESFTAGFTNGLLSGQVTLDSLRAAIHSRPWTGISRHPRIALNGGSGGAIACEWAAELQPTYAPELRIAGMTLGSLTPDVNSVYNTINGQLPAGLLPPAFLGLAQSIPSFGQYLNDSLVPETASTFLQAGKQCLDQNELQFVFKNISTYFKDPNFINTTTTQDVVKKYTLMGQHDTPKIPLYLYKGGKDEVSPVADTDALVSKYCTDHISSLTYVTDTLTGHISESLLGLSGAYQYIKDRLNDVPPPSGCSYISSNKTAFDDSDAKALGNVSSILLPVFQNALPPSPAL